MSRLDRWLGPAVPFGLVVLAAAFAVGMAWLLRRPTVYALQLRELRRIAEAVERCEQPPPPAGFVEPLECPRRDD